MFINRIYFENFRNLKLLDLEFSKGLNFIYGSNAQGKTNIIEAIFLLANARSFRKAKNIDYINHDKDFSVIEAEVKNNITSNRLKLEILSGKKLYYLNNKKLLSLSDYIGKLVCVSFTPYDLRLITGSPSMRRSFLDRYLSSLSKNYLNSLIKYNRALKSKNMILKNEQASQDLIYPWNDILAEQSIFILKERLEFISKINQKIKRNSFKLC